ncbi:MAG: ribonuclease R [Chlamydiales bacterium]
MEKKRKKIDRITKNIIKVLREYISGRNYYPQSATELLNSLGFPEEHLKQLNQALTTLIQENFLEVREEGRFYRVSKEHSVEIVKGILRVHPKGFGFLQPHPGSLVVQDIFIPKHLTEGAVDGDLVEVKVNPIVTSPKGPEGRVISIKKRSRTHLAGIVTKVKDGEALLYAPMLGMKREIHIDPPSNRSLKAGDRIIAEVLDWGTERIPPQGKFFQDLGHISDPHCDIQAAIAEYEIRDKFSPETTLEATRFGKRVHASDLKDREDFRDLECFTIDPDTAKDFDDALTLSKSPNGYYHLGVHIADVSHYVQPGSALDNEAKCRSNSTYFPGKCIPMLPPELSENLCSLKPNVNRLTVSVMMTFDPSGTMVDYRITRSVIKSQKRFTYRQAKAILDGKLVSPHAETLELMVELTRLLKQKRYERGSIEFSLPELVVLVDDSGMPYATDYVEYDVTHQLVEEFMLKTNETIAQHLDKSGKNLTYRVHDEPSEENLREFSALAHTFGFKITENPSPQELQKLFDSAMTSSYGSYLATAFIRRMSLASYSPDNIGHYGLALSHYCHFTSPIRRYVDLVVHRILFGAPDEYVHLGEISLQCSEQERISSKAENQVRLLKKLRFLEAFNIENPHYQFEAIVTQVKPYGYFFEVLDLMLESFFHISELDNDYFVYDEKQMHLKGRKHGTTYSPGTPINVYLKEVDLISLESKWYLIPEIEHSVYPKKMKFKKKQNKRDVKRKNGSRR